jgi:PHD/YefM family antitoxin component YafN of YafNO toxin-antitoxin module
MIMSDAILSLSQFKADASRLLRDLHDKPRTMVLTQNGYASAVVHDYDDFQRMQDGLLMLKLMVQGEADVQADRLMPQNSVFDEVRGRLQRKMS